MKTFQVLSSGKPIFFFEVIPECADDEASPRNLELAENLAGVLEVEEHGPQFVPQLISRLPLVVSDREPDHDQGDLKAWVSPKIRR